ncbi:unnamed protein product [Acanthosepion pharaonis]|uniref:Uncharacterized protein n=1 Tax=Acanthosepion pharaonis TaxID=158019 RepID=A0A812CVM0_ACAPH|nr:unnamed protein product [Sepia pharaonis]
MPSSADGRERRERPQFVVTCVSTRRRPLRVAVLQERRKSQGKRLESTESRDYRRTNGIPSSSSHSLSSSSSLRLGSIPASSECPAGVRFTSLILQRQHITGEVWPFLCLSPSRMFSPILPLSRQPRRGGRAPPWWGRARMTLFSWTSNPFLPSIRVSVVPFGVVHLSPARTDSVQVTRSSSAPTPSLLTTSRKVPDHTSSSCQLPLSHEKRPTTERKEKYLTQWWRFNCKVNKVKTRSTILLADISAMSEQRKRKSDLPEIRHSVFCFFSILLLLPFSFPSYDPYRPI